MCLISLGPSRRMVHQFWRMVWQEKVHCIVMATNVFEHARVMNFLHKMVQSLTFMIIFK